MSPSKIEQWILDRNFSYLQPYFYNHSYALRCELGIGEDQEYIYNAKHKLKPYFLQYDAVEMEKRFYAE